MSRRTLHAFTPSSKSPAWVASPADWAGQTFGLRYDLRRSGARLGRFGVNGLAHERKQVGDEGRGRHRTPFRAGIEECGWASLAGARDPLLLLAGEVAGAT